ncbi:DNA polymerase iii epsilon subunit [Anaeramoeba flamelloides]|uniref:DNA polymerase iii epsilon subunit n=1 Tax=Anaeramoeba flamelloides TaxID=1746091 RepID=A0AAV7Y1P6_9EUKA|nr:DNA polymerase iii epsilon subunit [Anaeramoeba flamelloides]
MSKLSNIDLSILKNKRCIVFDLETTGFKDSCIVEIGAVEVIKGKITSKTYHCLVNSRKRSNRSAYSVHKLGSRLLKNAPKITEIIPDFLEFVNGDILIAHNIFFDYGVLAREVEFVCGQQPTCTTKTTTKKKNNNNLKTDQSLLINSLESLKITNKKKENQQLNDQFLKVNSKNEELNENEKEKEKQLELNRESKQDLKSKDPNFEKQEKNNVNKKQNLKMNKQIQKEINTKLENQKNTNKINEKGKIEQQKDQKNGFLKIHQENKKAKENTKEEKKEKENEKVLENKNEKEKEKEKENEKEKEKENENENENEKEKEKEKENEKEIINHSTCTTGKLYDNKIKINEIFNKSKTFCTMAHSKKLFANFGFSASLNFLCQIFEIEIPKERLNGLHNALEDAHMTAKLLLKFLELADNPDLMKNTKKRGFQLIERTLKENENELKKSFYNGQQNFLPKQQNKQKTRKVTTRKFNLTYTNEMKQRAFHFFNTSKFEVLRKAKYVTKNKADTIIKLRPFSTFLSMIYKIDSSKGITSRVIEVWIEDRIKEANKKNENIKENENEKEQEKEKEKEQEMEKEKEKEKEEKFTILEKINENEKENEKEKSNEKEKEEKLEIEKEKEKENEKKKKGNKRKKKIDDEIEIQNKKEGGEIEKVNNNQN